MIEMDEYKKRRIALGNLLPSSSLAIISGNIEVLRNGDATYKFRQASDFLYFTGFNEPSSILVITGGPHSESILFCLPKDPFAEVWNGRRLGIDGAKEHLLVDKAYDIQDFEKVLQSLMQNTDSIFYNINQKPLLDPLIFKAWHQVKAMVRLGVKAPEAFHDLNQITSEMRLIKSATEIDLLRRSANISVSAHKKAMQKAPSAKNEFELEAELLYEFAKNGAKSPAYEPIVAGGNNACILHYTNNNAQLSDSDLILIDAGCEYEGYAADITRTFPKSGKFTESQKQLYEIVLKAQNEAIALVKPGVNFRDIHDKTVEIITRGLVELDILKGSTEEIIEKELYKQFYMHNTSHWLGIDVHDVGNYKDKNGSWRKLTQGMVLTVEPGIYIDENNQDVDKKWCGIGIRIEDDILVTEKGSEILTKELPKAIDEIEALISDK